MAQITESEYLQLLEKHSQQLKAEIERLERERDEATQAKATAERDAQDAEQLKGLHGLAYAQQKNYLTNLRRKEQRKAAAEAEAERMAAEERAAAELNKTQQYAPGDLRATLHGSDTDTLRGAYERELAKLPRGDIRRIAELKAKFRKRGLEVY